MRRASGPIAAAATVATLAALVVAERAAHRAEPRRPSEVARAAAPSPAASASAEPSPAASTRARTVPTDARVASGPPRMIHLDARHTNRSPFAGPVAPAVAWTYDAGGAVEAAPCVLDDGTIVVASLAGRLVGLDPATGRERFSVALGDRAYASPLCLGAAVVAGSDAKRVVSVGPGGRVRFRLEVDGEVDTGPAPLPSGGFVVAAGRVVHALRADGTILWRFRARRHVYTSPAVADDGAVYFGAQDDHAYAVGPDGKLRWRVNLGADVDGCPAIGDDGTVYFGTDAREVVALDPASGAVRARADVGGFVRGCASVARDGTVLVGTYGPAPRLVALDPRTLAVVWAYAVPGTGAAEQGVHGGPVEDRDGRLYFGAQDDALYALDADGRLLFRRVLGGDVDAPVALVADGTLLVSADDGRVVALRDP